MYFYRIAGAAILAFSGFAGAWIMNSSVSRTLTQTEALIALMRFIRIQIECFALPASEIIRRADGELLSRCGYCGGELPESFEELFEKFSVRDGEAAAITQNFARNFGKSYRSEQLRECDYYIAQLCDAKQRISDELPKRKKVNSTLCVSSALALIILLI
ncbi:MAG: stage III sporulation protein AB [Clostridia bacterium]|nr:stage III sporulation protein AB [Clostridia bacterium]